MFIEILVCFFQNCCVRCQKLADKISGKKIKHLNTQLPFKLSFCLLAKAIIFCHSFYKRLHDHCWTVSRRINATGGAKSTSGNADDEPDQPLS